MSSFDRDPEGLSAIIFLLHWLNKFPSTQLSLSQALKNLTVICFGVRDIIKAWELPRLNMPSVTQKQ